MERHIPSLFKDRLHTETGVVDNDIDTPPDSECLVHDLLDVRGCVRHIESKEM